MFYSLKKNKLKRAQVVKGDDVDEKSSQANGAQAPKENDLTAAQELRIINVILKSIKVKLQFIFVPLFCFWNYIVWSFHDCSMALIIK